jgi:pSer/pThr/pTyr-binding forkhead associated (FHA) protein
VLLADTEVVLGRSPYCTLALEHRSVSRLHAVIRLAGDAIEVEDLGSANGTFVRGARIAAPTRVRPGDEVRVGAVPVAVFEAGGGPLLETDADAGPAGDPRGSRPG